MATRAKRPPAPESAPDLPPVSWPVLSRQSARCLRFIADHPGASSTEVRVGVGMRHPSQASNTLARLERDGLAYTIRGHRSLNAWRLTADGAALLTRLPEDIYV